MGFNYKRDTDILKSIDCLRGISYKLVPEYTIREFINQSIQFLIIRRQFDSVRKISRKLKEK